MAFARQQFFSGTRAFVARFLALALLLGQLSPVNLIPSQWTDDSRWIAQFICTDHGLDGSGTAQPGKADDCCSMPCCQASVTPTDTTALAAPRRVALAADLSVARDHHPVPYARQRIHGPRAPPLFSAV